MPTEDLQLEPFSRSHFDTVAGWFADARGAALWGGTQLPYPFSFEQLCEGSAEMLGSKPALACFSAKTGDRLAGHGQIAFDRLNGVGRLCRIALAPALRGRGLSRPMLGLLVDEAFKEPDIMRVELNVYDLNASAIRAYKALGFVEEGVRRSSARFGEERWNTVMMGLLRAEWRKSRQDSAGNAAQKG
ncbi:GNAT family N-acetyltransferase [Martelella lutilitoris]|uniref:GNAT family N-acetyltransferase n=1 Tax=Martelella lutilitoris TaxID=2583532 RepID=A0A5C4JW77_9HYPH|nr:GNAT family protein [Martelella lutilitoris]TNB49514.1 GNAT family N-acetyltransferase [Martelella lutilitoris]